MRNDECIGALAGGGASTDGSASPASEPSLDQQLRAALRFAPAGVAIVTTGCGEAALGMTATSVTIVSLSPPTLLICVNRVLRLNAAIRANQCFEVAYLRQEEEAIARAFAGGVSGPQRFGAGGWDLDAPGGATLPGALIGMSCRLMDAHDYGSHTIFIAAVKSVRRGEKAPPLLYCNGGYAGFIPGESDQ